MMRNLSSSATQPTDLRRRHQARRDYSFRWESEVPDDTSNSGLDLSIHRPSSPFTPAPAVTRDREFHVSNSRRRPRNSRGTKEAKKRRDARRNRRKLAAQYLDEQLSREIDETLTKANIHAAPPVTLPAPTPVFPTPSFWPPQPQPSTAVTRRSPSPFQLPPLSFSDFDLHDFPLLASPKQSPPPLSPSPLFTGVPSWCPQIPALTGQSGWSCGWPKFFDLSHLPERKASLSKEHRCQELQIWQPDVQLNQRKQSRFFPPQPSLRPTVKLPSAGCTLHRSETDASGPPATSSDEVTPVKPQSIADAVEKIVAAVVSDAEPEHNEEPTAVNLWHILSDELEKRRAAHAGGRESSWDDGSHASGGVPIVDEQSAAVELDSKEIPYTHANSLTGYANETAELHSGLRHPDLLLADSAIYLAEAICSIDDASADAELATLRCPLTPVSPLPGTPLLETPLSLDTTYVDPPETNTDSDNVADSVAHYTSEQQLFEVEPPTPQSPTASECDLATFLSMGHVENCWCRDCEEEPELVNDEWSTPLTESEGWMMWSTADDEESADAITEPVKVAGSSEDGSWQTWTTGFDWDDFYPTMTPHSPVPELEDEFLGYYDDDYAFSQESDNDWMWSWAS